ncbi:MAG: hypothetical protein RLZZ196_1490 [Bacteroidota bacterium]|jgi:hypothetical protein
MLIPLSKKQLKELAEKRFCYVTELNGSKRKITFANLVVKEDEIKAFEETDRFKEMIRSNQEI